MFVNSIANVSNFKGNYSDINNIKKEVISEPITENNTKKQNTEADCLNIMDSQNRAFVNMSINNNEHQKLNREELVKIYKEKYNLDLSEENINTLLKIQDGKSINGVQTRQIPGRENLSTFLDPEIRGNSVIVNTHASVMAINSKLRDGEEHELADITDLMFQQLPPTEDDMTVFRGVSGMKGFDDEYVNSLINLKEGELTEADLGYSYGSFSERVASHYSNVGDPDSKTGVFMKIKVPKGSKVSYNPTGFQKECLFPRNTQFKVTEPAVYNEKIGRYEMTVEYVNPDEISTD